MKKTILFYNELHNGDIHMSRPYVMDMMQILGDNDYYYYHRNNPKILSDIDAPINPFDQLPRTPRDKIGFYPVPPSTVRMALLEC